MKDLSELAARRRGLAFLLLGAFDLVAGEEFEGELAVGLGAAGARVVERRRALPWLGASARRMLRGMVVLKSLSPKKL